MLERLIYRVTRSIGRMFARAGERLRRLADAVIWPIERAFAVTFGRLFRAAEGFHRVEDWLLAMGKLILWPFSTLVRGLAWMGGLLVPGPLKRGLSRLMRRLDTVRRRFARGALAVAERLNLDGAVRRVVWLAQPVWRPVAAVGGFVYAWLVTRPYRQMLWGLPALALLMPIGAAAAWGLVWGRGSVATNYRLAVKEAREAGDYERMQLFERKLEQLGVDTQQTAFNTALAMAEDGKLAEAYQRMKQLAPTDGSGYAPARFWIVQRLFRGDLKESPEEANRLAGVHLDQLEAARIKAPEIQLMRAEWLARAERLPEAAAVLKPLVHRVAGAAMQRMTIHMTLGNLAEAQSDARAVRSHMEGRQRRGPAISAYEYRWWAVAEGLLGDGRGQAAVFAAWSEKFPDDQLAKQGLAEIARREFDEQLRAARPDARRMAERIIEAAELGGDPGELSRRVAALFQERTHSAAAQATIEELMQSAKTPAIVLQFLGTQALVAGDSSEASKLLKRAAERNPQDAVAWNNYACSLMAVPGGDMDEALAAVEKALAIAPEAAQFRETRGQVLVRLERWAPAVEDLELAINSMPDSKAIHRSLAAAYTALGQQDLAAVHEQSAQ